MIILDGKAQVDFFNNENVLKDIVDEFHKYKDSDIVYGDLVYVKFFDIDKIIELTYEFRLPVVSINFIIQYC